MNISRNNTQRKAFTLVELVIVVLVLGIIAAAAAPKLFDTATDARKNSTRHSLVVLRNALELYRSQVGDYPEATDMADNLTPYLQGPFPAVQGATNNNSAVVGTSDDPVAVKGSSTAGWVYNESTGEIRINFSGMINW